MCARWEVKFRTSCHVRRNMYVQRKTTKSCFRQFMCKHKRIKVEKFSIEPSTELTLRFLLTPTRASRERPGARTLRAIEIGTTNLRGVGRDER